MNRKKLVIGLDMDGVVIDNTAAKIKFAKKFGFDLQPEETHADFIVKVLPPEVLEELRKMLYHNPMTALQAKTVAGAVDGLRALKKRGYEYYLISRRPHPELVKEILKKQKLWGSYFNDSNAFFVLSSEEKAMQAKKLGLHIYIDDQPAVLDKLDSVKEKILMDRFGCFPNSIYQRVASWKEFLKILLNEK